MAIQFDTPITTNDQSVDRVLAAGLPVLLVFIGQATPPPLEQAMSRVAAQEAGKLLVARVPVADNPATVSRYHISQAPAVVAIKDRQAQAEAQAITGAELDQYATYLLGRGPKPAPRAPQYSTARPAAYPGPAATGTDGAPKPVTDATFERDVMQSRVPVLVDFWAPWCGPCRMIEPVVEKMAREYAGRASFAKVNVDENPMIAQRYGIQSIPTMMVVKNGKIVDRWVGAMPEPMLRRRVEPLLMG